MSPADWRLRFLVRLWSLHPSYLDPKGLVALWREGLLAKKVLKRQTKGYRFHPQLERFKAQPDATAAIDHYLTVVYEEGVRRGYHFDRRKLDGLTFRRKIAVTDGQLLYEMQHLKRKLEVRTKGWYSRLRSERLPTPHPLFRVVRGGVAGWERVR
jgi:hypothetical protein